ncbi:MAG: hypothetical protein ABJG96_10990 [Paracoccaceae bacterium]
MTTLSKPELWKKIQAHLLDDPKGTAPFSVKLARQERWSKTYTQEVIEEYKRFVYLTQITKAQVTPSKTIDRAWHHHLTYTRDYWDTFVPDVLLRPLHHEPCTGDEDMPRYRKQFLKTQALYEKEFGVSPPSRIWGERRTNWPVMVTISVMVILVAIIAWSLITEQDSRYWYAFVLLPGTLFIGWLILKDLKNPKKKSKSGSSGCGGDNGGCGGCGGCGG